jgi:hypothetical protein
MEAKLWKDMTPEEKGALLLAHHEGKEIEFFASHNAWQGCEGSPSWISYYAYRVKPDPVRETLVVYGGTFWGGWTFGPVQMEKDTHKITLHFVDGVAQADASVEVL